MLKFILPLLSVFLLSCGQKGQTQLEIQTIVPELASETITLTNFVSAKPAAILSSRSTIEIEFNRNMVMKEFVEEELPVNPIDFEPAIKGKTKWLTTSLLQFTPNEPLSSNQAYKAVFNGKKAFGSSINADNYNFEFKIIPNEILEITGGFEPVAGKVNTTKLILELRFADKPDSAKLLKDLALKFNSKNMPHKIFFDQGNFVKIESENAVRASEAQSAEIILPQSWSSGNSPFRETFLLPAAGEFVAIGSKEASAEQGEKVWEVVFSDPIANDRDLSGFVVISPQVKHKVSVKNRTLKIKGNFSHGTQYTLLVQGGFPSVYSTKMAHDYFKQFSFNDEKPRLEWVGSGVYLPMENKGSLQFKSMNLAKATLEIQEILPQNLIFFLQNNDLRSSRRWITDIERTAKKIYSGEIKFENPKRNEWLKTEIDISNYFAKKAGAAYIVKLNYDEKSLIAPCKNTNESYSENDLVYKNDYYENPCDRYYYYYGYGNENPERILVASSIALTAKATGGNGVHVWATDVETSKPISGLLLEIYGKVNDILATERTDANGHVFFSVQEGYVVKGQGNRGLALLKLNQNNWETSRFDVGGVLDNSDKARLFGYTERGVYRPGDTIHFAGIVRESIEKSLANVPMSVSVKNPMGSVVFEGTAQTSADGMFSLDIPTELNAPTGQWLAIIKSGGNEWTHSLQVETVKPNRLKNTLELPEKMSGQKIEFDAVFKSKYLFGMPAAGLEARINCYFKDKSLKFPRFPDFIFKNQMQSYNYKEGILFEGILNNEGEAIISKKIDFSGANITEAATIEITAVVNEKGGGYTESRHSGVIYPYPIFVGLKTRNSWDGVRIGDTLRIPIITLNENGKIVSDRKLSVKIYQQNRYYSWWESGGGDSRWNFVKDQKTYLVHEETINSGISIKEFKWVPESEGTIAIEVKDIEGGHSASQFIYASRWSGSENMRNIPEASHLNLMSKKQSYNIGDSILISFDSPANGNAIVSLEYSDKILETRFVQANAGKNEISFIAAKNMLPNVYAVISLLLPLKSIEGEKPMRYYGILPIKIEDEKTKLDLALKTPKEVKPGEEFSIEVSNNSKEDASFTLAVTDEGLLDLTNFKTPDPWKFYFQKLALKINTFDNYNEIIGALMPDMDSYLSIGGGDFDSESGSRAGDQKIHRFKPVSLFSGVKNVKAGKTEKIKFRMPQYVGSVRAQLISVSKNAFSKNEANITVKKPLMILPTAPRAVKPKDKFNVPVSVFAMDNDIKNATVNIQVSPELKIIGKNNFELSFEKPGELDGHFEVEAMSVIGNAKIIVRAESGKHKTSDTIDLPLISSSAFYTDVLQRQISAGNTWQTKINPFGINNTHKATLVLSTMPGLGIDERLDYLINYPYGCLEQITSGMFPQLYITQFMDLDAKKKQEISNNLNDGIKRLAQYAMSEGFSYWPNQSNRNADPWATSYAGHFMLEAKKAGYSVPQNIFNNWKNWEQEQAKKAYGENFRNQAYRLYLLAVSGNAQMGAMNLMKENNLEKLDWLSKYLLAGAYHAAGKESIAKQVLEQGGNALSDYRENSGTYGSSLRDQALAALVLAKMDRSAEAIDIYRNLANEWSAKGWWSTQESAFALLAFSAIKDKFNSGDVEAKWSANGKTEKVLIKANKPMKIDLTSFGNADVSIEALNGVVFAELQTKGLPLEDNIKTENKGFVIQRTLYNQSGEEISASQIKQNEAFWITFTVKSLSFERIKNVALSSVLPSGFEIFNERLNEYSYPDWISKRIHSAADYTDIRDDRINWFFSLGPNRAEFFAVKVYPSFVGEFRWPGVVLEAMYSPNYFAGIAGEKVEVRGKR